jgi:eukaryotic-like serine/threonine-protein kinase
MNGEAGTNTRCWRFGMVEVDERRRELRVGGQVVAIEGKPYALLLALLRRGGETLSKEELIAEVWPGRVVTDGVLTKAVLKLRVALNDQDQQILRTVHGFGYRLLAPVEARDADDAPPAPLPFADGQAVPLRPNWRFLRRLGRGGFGDVWLAEHAKTREARVFKYAGSSAELAELKREITLSRLLHDSLGPRADLVRVIDWNLDDPPHFIETGYADGGSLDSWCAPRIAAGSLPLAQRIALAADIAEALAAAHSVGVLHKDLKPANVLVQEQPGAAAQIRIADFGSGRLIDEFALERLRITRLGFGTRELADGSSGTPFYLAPELLAGQPPSLAADVFALGVMLYQLASGDFQRPLLPGWERDIDDALLREDIAAAAEQDPQRRLGSAAELARRLRTLPQRRAQAAEAQRREAQWAQWRERERRARERRPWLMALGVLLLAASIATGVLAWREGRARAEAERQAAAQDAVLHFLRDDLLNQADPYANSDDDPGIRALLARARERAGTLAARPEVAVPVLTTIADALIGLGDHAHAKETAAQALQLAAALPPRDRARLEARRARADVDEVQGDWRAAQGEYRALQPLYRDVFGAAHPATLWITHQISWTTFLSGDFSTSAQLFCAGVDDASRLAGEASDAAGRALSGCALALCRAGRCSEALAPAQRALALAEQRHGPDAPNVAQVLNTVQLAQRGSGDNAAALATLDRMRAILEPRVAPNHPALSLALHERAATLLLLQRPDEALRDADSAVARRSAQFGAAHAYVASSRALRARALAALDRRDEARDEFAAALAIAERSGDVAIAERIRKAMAQDE